MSRSRETDEPTQAAAGIEPSIEAICEALGLAMSKPESMGIAAAEVENAPYERLKAAVSWQAVSSDSRLLAQTLLNLVRLIRDRKPDRCAELARLAREIARHMNLESERQPLLGEAELVLGQSLRRLGMLQEAERAFVRARLHIAAIKDRSLGARTLLALADLRDDQDHRAEGLDLRQRALGIYRDLDDVDGMGTALLEMARGAITLDDANAALDYIGEALKLIDRGLCSQLAGIATGAAAHLMDKIPKSAATLRVIECYWEHYARESVSIEVTAELDHIEGRLRRSSEPRVAEIRLRSAMNGFRRLGDTLEAAKACLALVILALREDRPRAVRHYLKNLEEFGRASETPLKHRVPLQDLCASMAARTATPAEAEAVLERITSHIGREGE
jgi:tetratricopeptide (TPR) repeat protein